VELWGARVLDGLACADPADRVKNTSPFVGGARRFQRRAFVMRKSQFIAICMFIGAVTMIGLALTGTLQMRVAHSPVVAVVAQ
jgi:hypothetical protein